MCYTERGTVIEGTPFVEFSGFNGSKENERNRSVTTTTVRQIHGEEVYDIIHWLASYAFYSSPPLADKQKRREIIQQRKGVIYFALFEDGVPVACAASTPMTQQVRGALFGMGGVFDVVTLLAARRKGYSRQVLAHLFAAIRQDERPLSSLYPFRESLDSRTQ